MDNNEGDFSVNGKFRHLFIKVGNENESKHVYDILVYDAIFMNNIKTYRISKRSTDRFYKGMSRMIGNDNYNFEQHFSDDGYKIYCYLDFVLNHDEILNDENFCE